MSAKHRFMVAQDEQGKVELLDFVQHKRVEQGLSRPSSLEQDREQAANAAKLTDEEVLEARAAGSDTGVEAQLREHLSAEEQADVFRYVLERRRRREQEIEHPPPQVETGEEAGVEDPASVVETGSSEDTCSDRMSFVSAVESAPSSRKDKKRRTQRYRGAQGEDFVPLPQEQHIKRLQNAVILKVHPNSLGRVFGAEIDQMNCMLLTQQASELRGGEPCQTRLMSSVEMIPATQEGVDGDFHQDDGGCRVGRVCPYARRSGIVPEESGNCG
jgi:hypothetical protein